MSTSLLEALLIASIGLATAILLYILSRKSFFELYRRQLILLSFGMLIMGLGGGFISYYFSIDAEKNTIIKTKVLGSEDVAVGTEAPVRTLKFQIEHPNVEHNLTVKPINPMLENSFEADIYLEIRSPDEDIVMAAQKHFETYTEANRTGSSVERWRHIDTTFVPKYAGEYTINVVPITIGIPSIEIWIMDPLKKDGSHSFTWR